MNRKEKENFTLLTQLFTPTKIEINIKFVNGLYYLYTKTGIVTLDKAADKSTKDIWAIEDMTGPEPEYSFFNTFKSFGLFIEVKGLHNIRCKKMAWPNDFF